MKEFRITLSHRSGELARLTRILANHGINLRSVAGIAHENLALVCLVVQDVAQLRTVLEDARIVHEEKEMLSEILENESGAVADLAARLSDAGVDIQSLYILARDEPLIEVGFTVDDPKKAKKALG
jgi:hypothetical protein